MAEARTNLGVFNVPGLIFTAPKSILCVVDFGAPKAGRAKRIRAKHSIGMTHDVKSVRTWYWQFGMTWHSRMNCDIRMLSRSGRCNDRCAAVEDDALPFEVLPLLLRVILGVCLVVMGLRVGRSPPWATAYVRHASHFNLDVKFRRWVARVCGPANAARDVCDGAHAQTASARGSCGALYTCILGKSTLAQHGMHSTMQHVPVLYYAAHCSD